MRLFDCRTLWFLTVLPLVVLQLVAPALAQEPRAGVVATLEGVATAARAGLSQPLALKFKDDVFLRDRIATGDRSLARLVLGGKATVTIRERSILTITDTPGQSTVGLESGKVAMIVARERMRPGETVEIRTANAIAGVRGTVLIVEVTDERAQLQPGGVGGTTRLYNLSGQTNVQFRDPTGAFSRQVALGPRQFASVTGTAAPTSGAMTPGMLQQAISGLSARAKELAGDAQAPAKDRAFGVTGATLNAALVGAPAAGVAPTLTFSPGEISKTTSPESPITPPNTTPQPPILPAAIPTLPPVTLPGGGGPITPGTGTRVKPSATGILVFGDFGGGRASVNNFLTTPPINRTIAMNVVTLPGDLSAFGTIWHLSQFAALTGAEMTQLKNFVAGGGGLYLTGEHTLGCCDAMNASVVSLLNQVVTGGGIGTVPGFSGGNSPFNPTARGGITATPNTLVTWVPAATGGLTGVSGANVFASFGGTPVGAVFDAGDLTVQNGRIVTLFDSNWLQSGGLENPAIMQNIHTYIDDPPTALSLSGPLFSSVSEALDSEGAYTFVVKDYTVQSSGLDPLVWFRGSTLSTGGLMDVTNSTIVTAGSFVRLEDGAQIGQSGSQPLVRMSASSLAAGGDLFELTGRSDRLQTDASGLVIGTDRPLLPGPGAPVFQAENNSSVTVGGSAYKVDTMLLEAMAPLMKVLSGSQVTTGSHAVDLVNRARVDVPADAVALVHVDRGMLTVKNGSLVNVTASVLNAANLVALSNGSTVNILNGALLSVSNGGVVDIFGALVRFTGTGNTLSVSNTFAPTAIIGGIPVAVSGPNAKIDIAGAALAGLGTSGSVLINGKPLTNTSTLGSVTGSLITVQNGGTVKVGGK